MELKDFISQTLTEIQAGVQDAVTKTIANKTMGAINPVWGEARDKDVQKVDFDIAITVSDKTIGDASAGIQVVGIKIGGGTSGTTETSNISRIRFSIPIVPPVTTVGESPRLSFLA